ncbi:MAG TPA: YCF48-related protein, partial [Acidobacteriota bacterium]|nr:YCF48-related protein [Acidobacteriota bacterium]
IEQRRDYYYTVAVNPVGKIWDAYFDPYLDGFFFSSWDSHAEVAAVQSKSGWDLEMTISFSNLDVFSDPGWNWQVRFHHASQHSNGPVLLSSADVGVTVQQDVMIRRPPLVSYYWPRPDFMQEVKPDLSQKAEFRATVTQLSSPPAINGRKDNEKWAEASTLRINRTDRMGEELAENQARARVGLTPTHLCLNLEGDGAAVERIEASQDELGDGMAAQMAGVNGVFVDQALFQNECFWILIQPRQRGADNVHQDYYMIIVDNHGAARGTRYDKYGAPVRSWAPEVELDLYDTEEGWGAEVLIDLETLEIPVESANAWGFNLFRNRLLEDGEYELQAWSFTGNNFLNPDALGTLDGITGIDSEIPRSGLDRSREDLLGRLGAYDASNAEQIESLRRQLAQLPLSTIPEMNAAREQLEQTDNRLGVIDAGEYYESVPHPVETGYPLMDVQLVGDHGWTVGPMGTILRTEDGGRSWDHVRIATDADLYRVDFVSSSEGWVAGGRMRISETNESMRHDQRGGYGYIFHTTDGGKTWECQFAERGRLLLGLDFVNEKVGYAVGERGYLLKTKDGGEHWTALPTTGTMNWLYGIQFTDELKGFAVGLAETVIRTSDGGSSWTPVSAPSDRRPYGFRPIYRDIAFNEATGCIVGQNGAVLISRDQGETWSPAATFFKSEIRDLMDLRSVHFVSEKRGYAVGELGTRMMVTEDGGASWSYRPLPDTEWLRAVWANPEGKVVLTGEREKVLLSEDEGHTWMPKRGRLPKADILGMLAHGDDAAINLNAFYAYYAINEKKTIVDLGALSDVHSSEYEETYNLEHDRNMWMIGVRTSTNFNEFETGNNCASRIFLPTFSFLKSASTRKPCSLIS